MTHMARLKKKMYALASIFNTIFIDNLGIKDYETSVHYWMNDYLYNISKVIPNFKFKLGAYVENLNVLMKRNNRL